jgi:hypothetical protein
LGTGTPASSNPWGSSNVLIATVSNTGLVSGLSQGTATINYTNANGCSTNAIVTVKTLPNPPTITPVTITIPQVVTLNATGCNGGIITWYNAAGTSVGTGISYTTPTIITANTTYSADCNLNSCTSSTRTNTQITINNCPQNLVHSSPIIAGTYQASGTIISNVTVPNTTKYRAANSITLSPGFKADSGTVFEAIIGGCN